MRYRDDNGRFISKAAAERQDRRRMFIVLGVLSTCAMALLALGALILK